MTMSLCTARVGGNLLVVGRGAALTSARLAVSVMRRQFSNTPPASNERPEFRQAELPKDNIQFKPTGILTTLDRLTNIMFMGEIFRALWLSGEVGCSKSGEGYGYLWEFFPLCPTSTDLVRSSGYEHFRLLEPHTSTLPRAHTLSSTALKAHTSAE